jgi:hypothetical protein
MVELYPGSQTRLAAKLKHCRTVSRESIPAHLYLLLSTIARHFR